MNIQTDGAKKDAYLCSLGPSLCGHQCAHPCISCSSSLQSPALETFLDDLFGIVDLCDACEPEGYVRNGASEACSLVHKKTGGSPQKGLLLREFTISVWMHSVKAFCKLSYTLLQITSEPWLRYTRADGIKTALVNHCYRLKQQGVHGWRKTQSSTFMAALLW